MNDQEFVTELTAAFDIEAAGVTDDAVRRVLAVPYRPRVGVSRSAAALAVAAVVATLAFCVSAMGQSPRTHGGAPAGVHPSTETPAPAASTPAELPTCGPDSAVVRPPAEQQPPSGSSPPSVPMPRVDGGYVTLNLNTSIVVYVDDNGNFVCESVLPPSPSSAPTSAGGN